MKNLEIVNKIYDEIFCNIRHGKVDLFLCGAVSAKNQSSYRDSLRRELEKNKQLSIVYPEDLFMEMLNRKKYDLLELERFLAKNSDLILIVCESPGSFTELGAFVNNDNTLEKVIVLLKTKYKKTKSFIRQGPVEYVMKYNKDNVIFYNNDIDETVSKLNKRIQKFRYQNRKKINFKDLNLISGQSYFIILLIYFYKEFNTDTMIKNIKDLYSSKHGQQGDVEPFDIIYSSAIKRLFKEGFIKKNSTQEKSKYEFTNKGHNFAKFLLSYVALENKTRIINGIRLEIMQNQYY